MTTARADPARTRIPVRELQRARGAAFDLRPDAQGRRDLAGAMGLLGLRKLSFSGRIVPEGRSDWRLEGRLGATVVQPCVVTLEPVTTRIEEPVERVFLADPPPEPEGDEVEMPEDDTTEPLGNTIDLGAVMAEALALALPAYPRAPGAELGDARFAAPGATPLTDAEEKPFSGLRTLRDALGDSEDGDGGPPA